MSQSSVKLITMPTLDGRMALGISLKVADIPLSSALRSGWHIEARKDGLYTDIQNTIKWYQAAGDKAAVEGLISAAQRGRALLVRTNGA